MSFILSRYNDLVSPTYDFLSNSRMTNYLIGCILDISFHVSRYYSISFRYKNLLNLFQLSAILIRTKVWSKIS